MSDFSKEIFAERLKEIAKKDFGGVGKLASKMEHNNLSLYTSAVQEPKATFIYKLLKAGVDIIFLFTGKRGISLDQEIKDEFAKLHDRIEKLEATLYRLQEENITLRNELEEKEGEIKVYRVNLAQGSENFEGQGMESSNQL